MKHHGTDRGIWGSKVAFVLAAAGSAIGLGNIWGFPTQAGLNGGAGFVFVYLLCVVLIGVPVMIAELTLGRAAHSDAVGTFKTLMPASAWKYVGVLGVIGGLVILSYYSVLAGWTLHYIWLTITGAFAQADTQQINGMFSSFTQDAVATVFLHLVFMGITAWVVMGGIKEGIERTTTFLMPVLFLILVILAIRSVTLPGAGEGLRFYLSPDFSKINVGVVVAALGQAFFSLSLGMGAMITYGSYLSDRENLVSSAFYVCFADLGIAVLAGFVIFPALFSVPGLEPTAGPGLIYVVLPNIFNAIPLGQIFGLGFYILLAIAALTSSISLLEVMVAYLIDQRGISRRKAAAGAAALAFIVGIPSALGNGAVAFLTNLETPFFSTPVVGFLGIADFLFGKVLLIVGAFFICLFIAWKWGIQHALEEIRKGNAGFGLAPIWVILIRWVCPVAIFIIFVGVIYNQL